MTAAGRPTLYSIPVHRAFADALVAGLIDRYADGALGLAEGLILLPSNRARSAMQAAFVRAGGAGLLMPRLAVIGDADLDGLHGENRGTPGKGRETLPRPGGIGEQVIEAGNG